MKRLRFQILFLFLFSLTALIILVLRQNIYSILRRKAAMSTTTLSNVGKTEPLSSVASYLNNSMQSVYQPPHSTTTKIDLTKNKTSESLKGLGKLKKIEGEPAEPKKVLPQTSESLKGLGKKLKKIEGEPAEPKKVLSQTSESPKGLSKLKKIEGVPKKVLSPFSQVFPVPGMFQDENRNISGSGTFIFMTHPIDELTDYKFCRLENICMTSAKATIFIRDSTKFKLPPKYTKEYRNVKYCLWDFKEIEFEPSSRMKTITFDDRPTFIAAQNNNKHHLAHFLFSLVPITAIAQHSKRFSLPFLKNLLFLHGRGSFNSYESDFWEFFLHVRKNFKIFSKIIIKIGHAALSTLGSLKAIRS
jgi:hypothetical protein